MPASKSVSSPEAWHRNTRMARTLGCLVAAMTVGALLLDWSQPERAPAAEPKTPGLMSLVGAPMQGAALHNPWHSIHNDPQRPTDTATDKSHFLIDRTGHLVRTASWEHQRAVGAPGVVRIALLAANRSNEMTPAQWKMTGEVVRALQDRCAIPADRVVPDDTIPTPEPATPKPTPRKLTPQRSTAR